MKTILGVLTLALALCACASDPDLGRYQAAHSTAPDAGPQPQPDAGPPPPPPVTGLCRLTGGGQIVGEGASPDSFGGNAAMFRGGGRGEWNHVTHEGEHFHAHTILSVSCRIGANDEQPPEAGFSEITIEGIGSYEGIDGCAFVLNVEDHGEGGPAAARDRYAIAIDCAGTAADYDTGALEDLLHGNLQIHRLPPGFFAR